MGYVAFTTLPIGSKDNQEKKRSTMAQIANFIGQNQTEGFIITLLMLHERWLGHLLFAQ